MSFAPWFWGGGFWSERTVFWAGMDRLNHTRIIRIPHHPGCTYPTLAIYQEINHPKTIRNVQTKTVSSHVTWLVISDDFGIGQKMKHTEPLILGILLNLSPHDFGNCSLYTITVAYRSIKHRKMPFVLHWITRLCHEGHAPDAKAAAELDELVSQLHRRRCHPFRSGIRDKFTEYMDVDMRIAGADCPTMFNHGCP